MSGQNVIYESDIILLQEKLLEWFKTNARNFLWRKYTASNYELIISEVFLQRTRAETVNEFLPSFFAKYPNWESLWDATEEELRDSVKRLGLYRQRARRLYVLSHEMKERCGQFPTERNQLEEIAGFGQYTTNAYELYILNKRAPLLDVNMARLLERFFGKRKLADYRYDPYLQTLAYRVVNHDNSKNLNWAILDFASLVCSSRKPICDSCILRSKCNSFKNNSVSC